MFDHPLLQQQQSESGSWYCISDADLFGSMRLDAPDLAPVRKAVAAKDYDAAYDAWGRYWAQRKNPVYWVDPATYTPALREYAPHLADAIVRTADQLFADDFAHATYRPKRQGRLFQWYDDTPDTEYIGLHYFFFLAPVARAYLLTDDEKYPHIFREIVCSWWDALPQMVELNDFDHAINNWGLGSALRGLFFIENYWLMRQSASFTAELHRKILRVILGHTRMMHDRFLREPQRHNGIPTSASFTITAGTMFPEFRDSERWIARGIERLRDSMMNNFEPDGGSIEQCPQYHLSGMRDATRSLLVLHANGRDDMTRDEAFMDKLKSIFIWPMRLVHPTGDLALFNSGVYTTEWLAFVPVAMLLFGGEPFTSMAARFIEPGLVPTAKNVSEYITFMDGDWYRLWREARATAPKTPTLPANDLLESSGLAALRSGWDRNARSLIFDFVREPWGGHPHAGRLSFDLFAYGRALAVQPGSTASYSMPVYNDWCFQTVSHNTVLVNGRSQRARDGEAMFHCGDGGAKARFLAWSETSRVAFVAAEHDLYQPITHRRAIAMIDGRYYVVLDHLLGGDTHASISWLLHCPRKLTLEDGGSVSAPGLRIVPDMKLSPTLGKGYAAVPTRYHEPYDPMSAWRDDVPFVCYDWRLGDSRRLATLLLPFDGAAEPVTVQRIAADASTHAVRIAWADHVDELRFDEHDGAPRLTLR
jgi:heparan-sulfate lyase